jgi:CheY-like chemotaxis protein
MAGSPNRQTPMTWLIVEDDTAIRNVIETMCELWGFNIISFKDGDEAMAYLNDDTPPPPLPNVALLDIRVPGPWGHEISARIREHSLLNNIGVILMTAYELPGEDEEQFLKESGADQLLFKPLPPMDDLLQLIREIIDKREPPSTDV